jgi:hypothetical protein
LLNGINSPRESPNHLRSTGSCPVSLTAPFTPTSASWLNLVERFFAEITQKRIRRGVFHSIVDLQMAINGYLKQHNANPKPFVWAASAGSIIEKANRGKQALESQH